MFPSLLNPSDRSLMVTPSATLFASKISRLWLSSLLSQVSFLSDCQPKIQNQRLSQKVTIHIIHFQSSSMDVLQLVNSFTFHSSKRQPSSKRKHVEVGLQSETWTQAKPTKTPGYWSHSLAWKQGHTVMVGINFNSHPVWPEIKWWKLIQRG